MSGSPRTEVPTDRSTFDRLADGRFVVPAAAWFVVATVFAAIQYLFSTEGRSLAGVWTRVDASAYLSIATGGYSYAPTDAYPLVAWFPLYPLAVRFLAEVVAEPVLAAALVSGACGLAATVLFWNWTRRTGLDRSQRLLALMIALLYAYGWFVYGVIYSDAMFLCLAVLAFLLVEKDHPVWAFAVVGLATAVRPTGPALALGVVVLVLERSGVLSSEPAISGWRSRFRVPTRVDLSRLRPALLAVPLVMTGVVAYSLYLGARFDEPLLWLRVQEHWSQGPSAGPESWFKVHMMAILIKEHELSFIATAVPQTILVVAAVAAVPFLGRRFGWGYAVYAAVSLFIVTFGANEMVGAGRYLMGVFPLAALLAHYLSSRRTLAAVWLGASGLALVVHMVLFARGGYLT